MIEKIKNLNVNKKELCGSILLLLAFFSFVVMMGVWTIHLNSGLSRHWYDVFWFLTLLGLCMSNYFFLLSKNILVISQNCLLYGGLSLIIGSFAVRREAFDYYSQGGYRITLVISAIVFMLISITNFLSYRNIKGFNNKQIFENATVSIKNSKWIILIILGIIGIRIYMGNVQPRWDGSLLYKYLLDIHSDEIFSFYRTSYYSHISYAYTGINAILSIAFDNVLKGISFSNTTLFVISVFSTYKILQRIIQNGSQAKLVIYTLMYAVSPLTLGMVTYNYMDQWAIYLMPIVVYTLLYEKWILHFFFAIVMCFTKETAMVQYFGLCLGVLIIEKLVERNSWKSIIIKKKWYGMLAIGIVWMFCYVYFPNWNGDGQFSINFQYIVDKLKVFFLLDFLWIYLILGIVTLFMIKKLEDIRFLIIVFCSDLVFVLFYCLFDTVNHPRYMGGHIFCLVILGLVGLNCLKSKCAILIGTIVVVLDIVSIFTTIDPVTKLIFTNYNVGNKTMISTDDLFLSDSMVYNFEYASIDKALNLGIEDIIDEKEVIFFPQIKEGWSWYFDGNYADWYNVAKDGVIIVEYWDPENNQRIICPNEKAIEFELCNISSYDKLLETAVDTGYYFYIKGLDNGIYDELLKNNCVVDNKEFTACGFVVDRAKIVLNSR